MLYQKIPSGRFWIMPNDFFEKYKLNSRDFMVYCFFVSKKDKKGKSYWSIRRMAEQCNMSYESVRRAIKSLEDQCLIDVEHCSVNGKKIQIFKMSIVFTFSGIVIDANFEQSSNASCSIVIRLFGKRID